MVEAIHQPVHQNNGPSEPKPYGYDTAGRDFEESKVSQNALGAVERIWNVEKDAKKVPLSLLRKPNRQTMSE